MTKTLCRLLLAPLLLLTLSGPALAKAFTPEDLFSDDQITSFAISPTGDYIAYVAPVGNTDIFTVAKLDGMKPVFTTQMGDKRYVGRYRWVNDERIMLWPAKRYGIHQTVYLTGEIQSMNFDGKRNVRLWGYFGGNDNRRWGPLTLENTLKDDPEHIMVSTIDGNFGVYGTRILQKMNIYNARMTVVERSNIRRSSFVVNGEGEAIMQWGIDKEFENIVAYKDKKGDWHNMVDGKKYLGVWLSKDPHVIMKRDAGNNTYELVKYNRFTKETSVLASTTNIDLSPIQDRDQLMIGYTTERNGIPVKVYFDENSPEAKVRRLLERSFPNSQVDVSNGSKNGKRRIVNIWSDQEPGQILLYDADSKNKLSMLIASKQTITRDRFAKMTPISFEARDGVKIHGYLTLPNDKSANAPMVVMVHGGPHFVRDYWGWDEEVQLLASNGYAVLQINFRGSSGYGEDFQTSGYRQWGLAMQDDITDGTLWAVKQGFADKNKLCIYGGSYGGYAALMGVVKEPDLFKCAIGYVGVYDLPLKYDVGDVNETEEGRNWVKKILGDDKEYLKKYSPARHADKIKAGVFLVHGGKDERVPIEHYEAMSKALDKANHPYEKMVAEGEGHGFAENENQYKLYKKMLQFLDKYLG